MKKQSTDSIKASTKKLPTNQLARNGSHGKSKMQKLTPAKIKVDKLATERKAKEQTKRVDVLKAGFSPEMAILGGDHSLPASVTLSMNPS